MSKNLTAVFLLLFSTGLLGQSFFDLTDDFLQKNVIDGLVRYSDIRRDPTKMNQLVAQIGMYDLSSSSDAEKKAFYINAYNILVIKHIIDHYPTKGPLTIEGFFGELKAEVAGQLLTLDELEKQTLYKLFPDPRLHFVLVCAAMGCPPLADFAYRPEKLDQQLKGQTSQILNLNQFIRVKTLSVEVPKIFEWYVSDFETESGSVIEYIDRYNVNNLGEHALSYYEYDWSLNEY